MHPKGISMCQLLGMNCNVPTDIMFSFEGFHRRGGLTDEHADGWGIAFFEEDGWRVFLDNQPSATSQVARFVREYPIKSRCVIAHIRKATQGKVSLANTHPFRRELWGKEWIFAHNGNLTSLPDHQGARRFQPIGNSDSEQAFCWLLDQIAQTYPAAPSAEELLPRLQQWAALLAQSGTFNFLLGWNDTLFAHCSTQLWYITRQAPFTVAHLADADLAVDFSQVTTLNDRVAVIATQPLTDNEQWIPFKQGELLMFRDGQLIGLRT
ncbi:MAG: class glutamine amidotransferase [Proteobacteria bacterium]|nr:class glutamine amidotransferase [Pseudomonadota bacterium]